MGWIYKGPHNRPKTKNELKAQGLDYSYFQQRNYSYRRPTATANKSQDDSNDGVGSKREPHERNTKKDGDYGRWSICKGSCQSS
jgi:hypothetical protein